MDGHKPPAFLFERRANQTFSERLFFSAAPLKTHDHIILLAELESILASQATRRLHGDGPPKPLNERQLFLPSVLDRLNKPRVFQRQLQRTGDFINEVFRHKAAVLGRDHVVQNN